MQITPRIIFSLLITTILLTACSVSKRTTTRYNTMTQRAQLTLQLDQHQYSIGCTMRNWHDELITLSMQPMLGIEMVRIEANHDSIWIFDKMNKRYAVMDYSGINRIIHPHVSYHLLEEFCNLPISTKQQKSISKEFRSGKHQLKITCKYSNREYNTLQAPKRTNTHKFKQVNLQTILPL